MRPAFTYIMSNKSHTLYVGSTTRLPERVVEHKTNRNPIEFTGRYRFTRLVWYEASDTREAAERRERQIKNLPRAAKVALIQSKNPNWDDLSRHFLALLMAD